MYTLIRFLDGLTATRYYWQLAYSRPMRRVRDTCSGCVLSLRFILSGCVFPEQEECNRTRLYRISSHTYRLVSARTVNLWPSEIDLLLGPRYYMGEVNRDCNNSLCFSYDLRFVIPKVLSNVTTNTSFYENVWAVMTPKRLPETWLRFAYHWLYLDSLLSLQ